MSRPVLPKPCSDTAAAQAPAMESRGSGFFGALAHKPYAIDGLTGRPKDWFFRTARRSRMEYCNSCNAVEQGFDYEAGDDTHEMPICSCCGEVDTKRSAPEPEDFE